MTDPQDPPPGLVEPRLLARFEERISDDLADRPLDAGTDELRHEAATVLSRAGSVSHYELLGISVGATAEEVHGAFVRLARRVHPELSSRLGFPEGVLRVLFEHATHAYLVLGDPQRRKDYDREHPAPPVVEQRDPEELAAVRRDMARKVYRRAVALQKSEQYHYVVELMRDAVHWDAKPEYHALLADALGMNPRWRDDAVENLQAAIRMAPRESGYRLRLAMLYEEMDRLDDAVAEYRDVLQKVPQQPDAMAALERLGASR